jgi:hypothetical protein
MGFQFHSAMALVATMSAQTLLVAAAGKHAALLVTWNTAHSSEGFPLAGLSLR